MSTKYVLLVLVLVTMVQTVKTNTTDTFMCKTDQGFTCKFSPEIFTKGDEPCITWFSCKAADYPEEKCFPTSKFCDGKRDCEDESDEIGCNCSAPIRYTLSAILREQRDVKDTSTGGIEEKLDDIKSKLDNSTKATDTQLNNLKKLIVKTNTSIGGIIEKLGYMQSDLGTIKHLTTAICIILVLGFVVLILVSIIFVGLAVCLNKRQSLTSASQMPRSVSSPTDPGSPGQMPSSDSSQTDPGSPGQMPSIDSPLLTSQSQGRSQESHCDSRPFSLRTKVNQI